MNNIEINVAGRPYKFTLPSAWDEMTALQIMAVCRASRKGLDMDGFLLDVLMGIIPASAQKALFEFYAALAVARDKSPDGEGREARLDEITDIASQFSRLLDLMKWLGEPSRLTKNPFPVLKVGRRKYQGPKEGLKDITYYDFALVDLLLRDMAYALKEDRPEDAEVAKAKIMAVLWKKPGEQYDEKRAEARAKIFSHLSVECKDAAYLFVAGSIRQIMQSFPRIFTDGQEADDTQDENYGHAEVILDLAGGKFGDIEKTQYTPLYTILMYLEHEARKAEKKQSQNV